MGIALLLDEQGIARRRTIIRHLVLTHGLASTAGVLRWIASGRAPLSNGYESLIWISLMVGIAGFLYKPLLLEQLSRTVREALEGARGPLAN